MHIKSVYTPGMPSPERMAELDEIERLVEAELPEILARPPGRRWGEALAQRVAAYELRKARERAGLSLDDAAGRAGMTADDLAQLEAGRTDAPLSTLRRVAAGYGCEVRITVEPAGAA